MRFLKNFKNLLSKKKEERQEAAIQCENPKSLRKEISDFVKQICENSDANTLRIMKETTRDLIDCKIADKALKLHSTIPTFELPDENRKLVSSAELIEKSAYTLIICYRGNWCT